MSVRRAYAHSKKNSSAKAADVSEIAEKKNVFGNGKLMKNNKQ